ncbi:MAG: hypothetical protein Q8Q00_12935 [Dehalococcoidia bacterium]|nr:hypothetical protein [Dehalococcoidia bacterium]
MAQWSPALILIVPAALAAFAAWRPGTVKVLAAALIAAILDLVTAFAFWLQADQRSSGDTVRLTAFVAVPAALITLLALVAVVKGLGKLIAPDKTPGT